MQTKPEQAPVRDPGEQHPARRPTDCSECLYWRRPPLGVPAPQRASEAERRTYLRAGYCRRGAPAPGADPSAFAHWPITLEDDWCGSGVRRDSA